MKPPTTKSYVLPYPTYRTTKEPSVALCVYLNYITGNNDADRLIEIKPFGVHMNVAMHSIYLKIANFDG